MKDVHQKDKNNKPSPTAYFLLHFTFNETDSTASDFAIEYSAKVKSAKENEVRNWADVPSGKLLPSTLYRVMIEAQNEEKDGVYGTYFDCTTSDGWF